MKLKRFISLGLSLFMMLSSANVAFASETPDETLDKSSLEMLEQEADIMADDKIVLDDVDVTEAVSVYSASSTDVAYAVEGGNIYFDASTGTVIDCDTSVTKVIQFTAGSNVMLVNGDVITIDNGVQAEITSSRLFIPFRTLGKALGVDVTWDADTKTAIYEK